MVSKKDDPPVMPIVSEEYLKEREAVANQQAFVAAMQKVPKVPPSGEDRLP